MEGIKDKTILYRPDPQRPTIWGDKDEELLELRRIGREHAVKYCDSDTCIRTKVGLKRGESWHEGVCTECYYNPYLMYKKDCKEEDK